MRLCSTSCGRARRRRRPNPGDIVPIAGRIRVVQHRFQNNAGWWAWYGQSDFWAVADVLNGTEHELIARLDAYAAARRTIVRIIGNLGQNPPYRVDHREPGYWAALESVRQLCAERGLYMEFCCYGAAELIKDDNEYRSLTRQYAEWAKANPSVVIRLVNEPYKNGFSDADDPRLLALAEIVAEVLGHRDFAIGDPADENPVKLAALSNVCQIAVLHPSRQEDPANRYRRWIDHLKESADLLPTLASDGALVLDEPMGAGVRSMGKRDDDPDAHLAAMLVAAFCGAGYTYHWIPAEHAFAADNLPGLQAFSLLVRFLPISPDWHFSNSEPVASIVWRGLPGKTRSIVRGGEAYSVAYGEADWGSRVWNSGWRATDIVVGDHIRVAKVTK